MAKAKKLPSGNWNIRVGSGKSGLTKSFTAPTKKEVELMAAEYAMKKRQAADHRPISDCIDEYINHKTNVLSPSTIDGYKRIKQNYLDPLGYILMCDLTSSDVQALVNRLALQVSAKTVRNAYGLLSAVVATYRPDLALRVTLPQRQKQFRSFPDAQTIVKAFRGSVIEIPVLFALWEGMRLSEIRGAKRSDITDGILTIHSVIVTVDGEHIEKTQTKTYTSARQLRLPPYILSLIDALPPDQDYITTLSGHAIYARFSRTLKRNGIQHIRFHDLRHLNASVMTALGIPDRYQMERGGWSNPAILNNTYQHTFTDEREKVDAKMDEFFGKLLIFDTNCDKN